MNAQLQAAAAVPRAGRLRGARMMLPGQAPDGTYILSVLVKRSYQIVPGARCEPAEEDRRILPADVFWDEPMNSSVRYESDFIPFKLATDVVLNATAHAPNEEATQRCQVAFQVGDRRRVLDVIGDRLALYTGGGTPAFTEPRPFTQMPLRYERAYGGTDVYSDKRMIYPYPRNPLGKGFAVLNTKDSIDQLPLPNVEDPANALTPEGLCLGDYREWQSRSAPAGFGWVPKTWMPRGGLAGILPADRAMEVELRKAYAQLVPADQREAYLNNPVRDMDFRFFNGASPGFIFERLRSGERVLTENLTPEGALSFVLPSDWPKIGLDVGMGLKEPAVALHTVMIDLDARSVDLLWRGAVPYPGPEWFPQMRKCEILVDWPGEGDA